MEHQPTRPWVTFAWWMLAFCLGIWFLGWKFYVGGNEVPVPHPDWYFTKLSWVLLWAIIGGPLLAIFPSMPKFRRAAMEKRQELAMYKMAERREAEMVEAQYTITMEHARQVRQQQEERRRDQ